MRCKELILSHAPMLCNFLEGLPKSCITLGYSAWWAWQVMLWLVPSMNDPARVQNLCVRYFSSKKEKSYMVYASSDTIRFSKSSKPNVTFRQKRKKVTWSVRHQTRFEFQRARVSLNFFRLLHILHTCDHEWMNWVIVP